MLLFPNNICKHIFFLFWFIHTLFFPHSINQVQGNYRRQLLQYSRMAITTITTIWINRWLNNRCQQQRRIREEWNWFSNSIKYVNHARIYGFIQRCRNPYVIKDFSFAICLPIKHVDTILGILFFPKTHKQTYTICRLTLNLNHNRHYTILEHIFRWFSVNLHEI